MVGRLPGNRVVWGILAVLLMGAGFGLYWFQPWRLFTSTTVDDALTSATAPAGGEPAPTVAAGPRVVLRGTFVTHEHDTPGEVRVVEQPDGRRQLEIVNLNTSDGPDLRIWLADQPVKAGVSGWRVFDDGRWVE